MQASKLRYYAALSGEGLLNSYAQIFFSKNRIFAVLLLLVSFFDLGAGLSGVIAILIGQITALLFNYPHAPIRDGTYSYNALMVGIAIGIFYQFNFSFFTLLLITSILTFFMTIWFATALARKNLPFLSIPFLLVLWIVILGAGNFTALQLSPKESLSLARYFPELFTGSTALIGRLPFANAVYLYLRSLGAIIFQFNDLAGLFIAIGILIYSRIAFSLSIFGFAIGYLFYYYLEGDFSQLIYSYIGFNFILTAIALGGFFVVPSRKSFFSLLLVIPMIALLISALDSLFSGFGLPLYSLPFNIVVLLFLTVMAQRYRAGGLQLVAVQQFSPEKNHYKFYNTLERFRSATFFQIALPFIGTWRVSQGYDGEITHKDDWAQALDFDVTDESGKTFREPGLQLKDYYCYDLPVTAPADGWVAEIVDGIDDNAIGEVDIEHNWGNTLVIKHSEYLYSSLSHLKKDTFQVKKGDFVRKGDIVAYCGSSGRSPEPHLHFQIQATPFIGSKTIAYPLSYYLSKENGRYRFHAYEIPEEGALVSNVQPAKTLKNAFHFIPGMRLHFEIEEDGRSSRSDWEVFVTAGNLTYLYCHDTKSTAYFVNDGTLFYFTDFYGDKRSFLYRFYLAAHKILLGYYPGAELNDRLLIDAFIPAPIRFVHDFAAPFFHFCRAAYRMQFKEVDDEQHPGRILLGTTSHGSCLGRECSRIGAELLIENNRLEKIEISLNRKKIKARCID